MTLESQGLLNAAHAAGFKKLQKIPLNVWGAEITMSNMAVLAQVSGGKVTELLREEHDGHSVGIVTADSPVIGYVGDWLICGTHNEWYPIKPQVKVTAYREVPSDA